MNKIKFKAQSKKKVLGPLLPSHATSVRDKREPEMHKDIKKLNKLQPPPEGYRHPAYEVTGRDNAWHASYLNGGNWIQSVETFPSEAAAFRHILDVLYYGEKSNA